MSSSRFGEASDSTGRSCDLRHFLSVKYSSMARTRFEADNAKISHKEYRDDTPCVTAVLARLPTALRCRYGPWYGPCLLLLCRMENGVEANGCTHRVVSRANHTHTRYTEYNPQVEYRHIQLCWGTCGTNKMPYCCSVPKIRD